MPDYPRGLLRWGLRLPIWLYRVHLGWLLGERFLLLEHVGRRSGCKRQAVIEVVKHDPESDSYFVVSGWGRRSDWFQNLKRIGEATIWVGRRRLQVHAQEISTEEATDVLADYTRRYPRAFKELTRLFLGEALPPGRASSRKLAERMPMVAFRRLA